MKESYTQVLNLVIHPPNIIFILHHIEHTLSSRVVLVNEEINMVEPVLEEEQLSVEVGFDICGTNPKPELPVDQGKPWMHLKLACVLKSFTSLILMFCFIR
jgi:hypothetical protein